MPLGRFQIAVVEEGDVAEHGVGLGLRRIEFERPQRNSPRGRKRPVRELVQKLPPQHVRACEAGVRRRVRGVERDGTLETRLRLAQPLPRALLPMIPAAQVQPLKIRVRHDARRPHVDRRDEPIAAPWDRDDERRGRSVAAQRRAEQKHLLGEVLFGHFAVRPEVGDQLGLGHHAAVALQEALEQFQRLRPQWYVHAVQGQTSAGGVEGEGAKRVGWLNLHGSRLPNLIVGSRFGVLLRSR